MHYHDSIDGEIIGLVRGISKPRRVCKRVTLVCASGASSMALVVPGLMPPWQNASFLDINDQDARLVVVQRTGSIQNRKPWGVVFLSIPLMVIYIELFVLDIASCL